MTLNDIMPFTETCSLIKIQHGSKTIYCGENEKLDEKLDDKYYELPIVSISSRPVNYNGLCLPALYIYFCWD